MGRDERERPCYTLARELFLNLQNLSFHIVIRNYLARISDRDLLIIVALPPPRSPSLPRMARME